MIQARIKIDENLVGIWVVKISIMNDYLGAISFNPTDKRYELLYRIRHYKDEKVWDSKDEKNWVCAQFGALVDTREKAIEMQRKLLSMVAPLADEPPREYLVTEGEDLLAFGRRFSADPMISTKIEVKQ